ncbi:MAG: cysteine desulfurase [Archaeoglobi archaeon]|nr:cysteine desulfurase [Candidatus Mnemosynella bozhongmuii]
MVSVEELREEFPLAKKVIYFDNAATTLKPLRCLRALEELFTEYSSNYGRSAHRLSQRTTEKYEEVRERVASFLNASPEQIVFVRNTTEAINLVSHLIPQGHVISTVMEHNSNLLPFFSRERTLLKPRNFLISLEDLERAIRDDTSLITITHASNVLGNLQPVEEICRLASSYEIPVLIDSAQTAGTVEINLKRIKCDFMAISAHKGLLAPQGTGILYIREPERYEPLYLGGGIVEDVDEQSFRLLEAPQKFEAGTPNIPGVIALGASLELIQEVGVAKIERHLRTLTSECISRLSEIEGIEIISPEDSHSIVSFNLRDFNFHDVSILLDELYSICTRSGKHCAHLLFKHLNLEGCVRASFAIYNTLREVERFAEALERISKEG